MGTENAYYQYFCGEKVFASKEPCVDTELVEFRKRIGEEGIELIFKDSIRIIRKNGHEQEATTNTDTTVQEKNIAFPADAKLHKKIITKCMAVAERDGIKTQTEIHPGSKGVRFRATLSQSSKKQIQSPEGR